ncbi:MAG: sterol desaturase family protein [Planctomycetota bacterium JB042]
MSALAGAATSFALLLVVFLPLEALFPARRQRTLRPEWTTDLLFFLGQSLLFTAPVVAVLVGVDTWIDGLGPLDPVRAAVARQPLWLQGFEVVLLCDLGIYWAHRWSHRNAFLWRFHRVHHTAERLDWLAAYREHPVDNLYTRLVENLPAIVLGFPLEALAGFAVFRGIWAIYIHSNVSLTPGPLRVLLGAPRLHHWHHELDGGGRVNFANLSPLMDVAFGTYHDPGRMPERYGIRDDVSHAWPAQLVDPLLPASLRERLRARLAATHPAAAGRPTEDPAEERLHPPVVTRP